MPAIRKRNCDKCGTYYEGVGKQFCSWACRPSRKSGTGKYAGATKLCKNCGIIIKREDKKDQSNVIWERLQHCSNVCAVKTREPWNKGKTGVYSEEVLKKMRENRLGKKTSEETREKIRKSNSGENHVFWGKKRKPFTEEARKNMGDANRGKKRPAFSEEWKKNIGKAGVDRVVSIESRKKRGESLKLAFIEGRHPMWKGGITPVNEKIRKSFEYKQWRESVFKRDNYTCVDCGQKGVKLNADHIKTFANHPEFRFDIDNGQTLCVPCHKIKTKEDIKDINKFRKEQTLTTNN